MLVSKWGNSLAVRLPRALVDALRLEPGDKVELEDAGDGRFILRRDDSAARFREGLRDLRVALPADHRFEREDANER